jgi:hypothetical protein
LQWELVELGTNASKWIETYFLHLPMYTFHPKTTVVN